MWSTGNFKTSEGDTASRKSLFGRGSYLWLPSLDGNSKVKFYNWSNVEFTASGHTTLSKWASCFSWAKAFVNNLQSDFKPNQLTKHGTRASRSGGGLRWPEAEAVWKAQCYIPVTAAPLQLYLDIQERLSGGTGVWGWVTLLIQWRQRGDLGPEFSYAGAILVWRKLQTPSFRLCVLS